MNKLAKELIKAMEAGHTLSAAGWSLSDEAAAYAVQDAVVAELGWHEGGRPQRWKSGGASRTAGLSHAPLAPEGIRPFHGGIAEAEIALRIARDVSAAEAATLTQDSAAALVDAMCISIELVSSRWAQGAAAPALLRLADFGSHGALVLGDWLPFEPARDWAAQAVSIRINEAEPMRGLGCHPLSDPAWLLPGWLRHATRNGQTLPAGSVVTTGAWLVAPGLKDGDQVTVQFDGLGTLSTRV